MRAVRVGGPIALIVIGLILALAVADMLSGVDLTMIGWIVAGAGAVWLVLELVMNRPRSRVTEARESSGGIAGAPVRREEYREDL